MESKNGIQTNMYHVNMLKKYIAREPEVDVLHASNKDVATIAVAGVIKILTQSWGGGKYQRAIIRKKTFNMPN